MFRRVLRALPALLLAVSLGLVMGRKGETVPLYAARTGLLCSNCHFDPNGGGPRNEFGFAFARNRHSLTPESDSTSQWRDLSIGNRVGENFPLYFGVNQRFMLLANQNKGQDSLARAGFFNMENAIHLAFQPHPRLTLVYSFDAFSTGPSNSVRNKEGFGMIGGFPLNGYLKAGRFRNPFGLRLDDHTVATRQGFLDFDDGGSFLPYDPRYPDMGLEIGAEHNGIFGRAAFTNGDADPFAGQFAAAKSLKLGYNASWYQGALSFYDNFSKVNFSGIKRQTRWGYYGMTHYAGAVLLGEIAAGTDEAEPPFGLATGAKKNRMAGFIEADYAPTRSWNARVRYDRMVLDETDSSTRDASTHSRVSFEGEWVPVPFAELRGAVRRIHHEDAVAYGFPDETQMFLQLHFSY
jgi:hypothetical protein